MSAPSPDTNACETSLVPGWGLLGIPADSVYAWRWEGAGPLEASLAVRGSVELLFDGDGELLEGERDAFRLVSVVRPSGSRSIAVRAVGEGAVVADLSVRAL